MTLKSLTLLSALLVFHVVMGQEYTEKELSINQHVDGTLLIPTNSLDYLVIIIPGSGPTDRDGNQNFLKSNTLKKLALGLAQNQIASFRYDKRVLKQMRQGTIQKDILFDNFIEDAIATITYFSSSDQFTKIIVAGHSQGSLVGMVAHQTSPVHGFISLAGAGNSIDQVILDQVGAMAPGLLPDSQKIIEILKKGETTDSVPPALMSLFNKEVQPFMSNWMTYSPTTILGDFDIPILIVGGTKDLQVSVEETQLLKEANSKAALALFENMNHVLTTIEGDQLENSKSYNEPQRPLTEGLIERIVTFIKAE